jgi:CheY-like chemotaxis protein
VQKLVIFLAEDSRGDVLLVREALEKYHVPHELQIARDGGEALDYVSHMGETSGPPCPDVILLDLNLPKADGFTMLTEFRKHPQCSQTPVIVISSSDAPKDRERGRALGIARYFRKPSDLDEFLELGAVVRQVVSNATGTRN